MAKKWKKTDSRHLPLLDNLGDSALYLCKETKKGVPFVGFYSERYSGWIVNHYRATDHPVVVTHYRELKCLS